MSKRLYGGTADEMRAMCLDWYLRPLARKLMNDDEGLLAVTFALHRPRPGAVGHRVYPGVPGGWPAGLADAAADPGLVAWWPQVDRHRATLLGCSGDDLDGDGRFTDAFAPFCAAGAGPWPYAIVRRTGRNHRGDVDLQVEVVGVRHAVDPAPMQALVMPVELPALRDGLGAGPALRMLVLQLDLFASDQQPHGDPTIIAALREAIAATGLDDDPGG